MYEYIPKKSTKKVTGMVIMLAAAAALLFFIPSFFSNIPYAWGFQLCGFALLVAIIYITTRYVSRSYIYRVIPREGSDGAVEGYDLMITELSGKSRVTVCRLGLERISRVEKIDQKTEGAVKELVRQEKRKRFIYLSELDPEIKCCIFAEECGEPLAVTISSDGHLFAILEEAAKRNGDAE